MVILIDLFKKSPVKSKAMKDSKCFEFTYLEVLVTYSLFGCGKCKRRDNKTVDLVLKSWIKNNGNFDI